VRGDLDGSTLLLDLVPSPVEFVDRFLSGGHVDSNSSGLLRLLESYLTLANTVLGHCPL
jgi:hypothetical protein